MTLSIPTEGPGTGGRAVALGIAHDCCSPSFGPSTPITTSRNGGSSPRRLGTPVHGGWWLLEAAVAPA